MLLTNDLVASEDVLFKGECPSCGHRVSWYMESKVFFGSRCRNCSLYFDYNTETNLVKVYDNNGERAEYL